MKICSKCKSDMINVNNHVGLKVVLCILILVLIPFGIFLFWLPLLISSTDECQRCGSTDVEDLDWREFEKLKDELRKSHPEPPQEFDCYNQSSYTEPEDK